MTTCGLRAAVFLAAAWSVSVRADPPPPPGAGVHESLTSPSNDNDETSLASAPSDNHVTSPASASHDNPLASRPPAEPALSANPTVAVVRRRGGDAVGRAPRGVAGPARMASPAALSWRDWAAPMLILAGLVGAAVALRRWAGRAPDASGGRPLEILSRVPLSSRQSVVLLRLGRSVLVLGVGHDRVTTLAHVTDPLEAVELVGAAAQRQRGSVSAQFTEFLGSAAAGFAAPAESDPRKMVAIPSPHRGRAGNGAAHQGRGSISADLRPARQGNVEVVA